MDTPREKRKQDAQAQKAIQNFVMQTVDDGFLHELYSRVSEVIAEELKDFAQDDDTSVWVAAGYEMPTREEELAEMIPDLTESLCFGWLLLRHLRASFIPDTIDELIETIKKDGSQKAYDVWTNGTMDLVDAIKRVLSGERKSLLPLSETLVRFRNYNQAKLADAALHDPEAYNNGVQVEVFGKVVSVVRVTPQKKEEMLRAMPQASRAIYRTVESYAAAARNDGKDTFEIPIKDLWITTVGIPKSRVFNTETRKLIDGAMEWLRNTRIWIDASHEYGRVGTREYKEQPLVGYNRVYRKTRGQEVLAYEIDMKSIPLFTYAQNFSKGGQNAQIHRAYTVIYDVDENGNILDTIAKPSLERADIRDEVIDAIIGFQRMKKHSGSIDLAKLAERTGARYDNKGTRNTLRNYVRIVLCNLRTPQGNGRQLITGFEEIKKNCAITGYKIYLPTAQLAE